ncbi:MAG: phage antirepressor protein [Burkholderiales bacterium]|nr:MAG: phage antirepressor protein [Burkholderiales bacterium]
MDQLSNIVLFEDNGIRSHWDADQEEWFFSVVDVVTALTDSTNPTYYLKKLRNRDEQLGDYVGTRCPQVAMV